LAGLPKRAERGDQVSKLAEYDPSASVDVRHAEAIRSLSRDIWIRRIVGGLLLAVAWTLIALPQFGSLRFVTDTVVLLTLGAYALLAAASSRRVAVNLERKLRMRLLVHNMELETLASRDDLTQLFNRRYFFDRLERELTAAKESERPLAVILLDIDSLKAINDSLGHQGGDEALTSFGRFLLDQTRASDVPARIGGDEFAIILPDTSERGASVTADRIAEALNNADLLEDSGADLRLSASMGSSGYPWDHDTVDSLLRAADAAMYAVKRVRNTGRPEVGQPGEDAETVVPAIYRRADTSPESTAKDTESAPS
jgi:diguanylate cyclase (GGDEF)-like protein